MFSNRIVRWSLVLGLVLLSPAAARAAASNRIDDHRLERDVLCALVAAPELDTSQVTVKVRDGVVTLAGYTRSNDDRVRQFIVASQVRGVRQVIDLVEPDWLRMETTQALEQRIRNHLRADPTTAWVADDVAISAHQGTVTLAGKVSTPVQREEAERLVRQTRGVFDVNDELRVDSEYSNWSRFAASPMELGEPFL